jgi:Uma2 family endonuclease
MQYITDFADLDLNGTYSYADYLLWRFEQSVELIKGKVFKMSPAPSVRHQRVSGKLYGVLFPFFRNNTCQFFSAPFDVRLLDRAKSSKQNKDIYTVVQPDLCVICDKEKLDEKGCIGSPDLIIEILSPGNSKKEMKIKYALYEESGVREYWVVYPSEYVVLQFVLNEGGKYELKNSYAEDEILKAHIFPEVEVDLGFIFAE